MSTIPITAEAQTLTEAETATQAGGRLAVLTAMAMATRAIPLPFVPDRVLYRIRGAVAHDVATRHGLSLTTDARAALAAPNSDKRRSAMARKLVELASNQVLKRLGPLGALSAVARSAEVFALGHLFDRYVRETRESGAVRIHEAEAKTIRELVDRAVLRALSPQLTPRLVTAEAASEDLRDEFTRWIDAALLTGAALPSYVERRLDAAFDAVVAERIETSRG